MEKGRGETSGLSHRGRSVVQNVRRDAACGLEIPAPGTKTQARLSKGNVIFSRGCASKRSEGSPTHAPGGDSEGVVRAGPEAAGGTLAQTHVHEPENNQRRNKKGLRDRDQTNMTYSMVLALAR